ncbi:MAG TPA: Fe-S protein assembly co-chaperone HscB [Myxococcales bacterium]|nr:Fe-S protein assembly co-chaperone HscB [Myxococcales bacterium]
MLQPLPPGTDRFAIFGLPRRYEIDLADLEKRFRDLSWEVHPDRHAKGTARERRVALERTTALNDAYRTLKDPLKRAAYLLELHGVKIESESGRDSAMAKLPPEFLEEVMELREGLVEARAEGDDAAVQRLVVTVKERRAHAVQAVEAALRELPEHPDQERIAAAGAALARIRYYDRFDEEVQGRQDA